MFFGAFLLVQSKLFSMQSFCKPTFIGDDYILRVTGNNLVRDDKFSRLIHNQTRIVIYIRLARTGSRQVKKYLQKTKLPRTSRNFLDRE